ncbi:hypothetical protein K435DRAFT_781950 [Dendrothele bispora CBS 962.96]|uniref:Uncharacterized protein n=1 Tax=Dendrothele bispora (strain CBS 962.96) TaxID=1314807 RepID=A0A4S8LJ89_DENBC|nr:hypothetical protein K435DRAFT_781950 [Dendrothele bispora CBS 962.96]
MSPHPHYYHACCCWHSRILWFLLGASSATVFIWHKEARHARNSRYWNQCVRPPIQVSNHPPRSKPESDEVLVTTEMWPKRHVNSSPPVPAPVPWGLESFEQQKVQWEQDKERLLAKMTDLSEATLESISNMVDALKAKLAEYRAQREEQQKVIEQQEAKLDHKRDPSRHV